MLSEHPSTVLHNFQGLYSRGNDELCPRDHLLVATNIDFTKGDARSRFGSTLDYTLANIVRIRLFKKVGEATRVIALNNAGSLYDLTVSNTVPILTIEGMTDFALYTYYNRAYISPSNGVTGVPGEKLYVYDGTTCRPAAGNAPTGVVRLSWSAEAGHVSSGYRFVTVAFETESGFITKTPYNTYPWGEAANYALIGAGGDIGDPENPKKLQIDDIPLGPVGTVARYILVTPAWNPPEGTLSSSFRAEDFELFYAPGGRIGDNTTTSLTLDFYETDLVDSADDLLDQYEEIPAGVGLADYNGRLIVYGIPGNESQLIVSRPGEPEAFSKVDGFINTDSRDSSGIKNCRELRGQLYIFKSLQQYTTQDNGDSPDTWSVITVDKGFGAEPEGIADVLDARGAITDTIICANRNGLMAFNGSYILPELSWKIEAIWKRINKLYFSKVQVVLDQINHLIYVTVPLDAATTPNCLLVGYYETELSAAGIKWSQWYFDHDPTCFAVDVDYNTLKVTTRYASNEGNVYKFSDTVRLDNNVAFQTIIKFPFVPPIEDSGQVYQIGGLRSRIKGSGVLNISISGIDNAVTVNVPSWTLTTAPGADYARQCDFTGERGSVQFSMSGAGEYFILTRLAIFAKAVWSERPA